MTQTNDKRKNNFAMLLKNNILQTLIICLISTGILITTGCRSRSYKLAFRPGGTVVPNLRNVRFYYPEMPWVDDYSKVLEPGYGAGCIYYGLPMLPTKVCVEFDDESGKHHFLMASCKLPEDFDGQMMLLVTRRENLGKTGDIACIDCVDLKDYSGKIINCQAGTVTMLEASEENYDEDYLLKVYLGDWYDFMADGNDDKFIRSLQREDEYCESNLLLLARGIPDEYEIKRILHIHTGKVPPCFPIISEKGKRPEGQKDEREPLSNQDCVATEELPWYHDITRGPLYRVEMDILGEVINSTLVPQFRPSIWTTPRNRTVISHLDAFDLGIPDNLRGDIVVFLVRDGDSYQLRIFVDDLGALVAYKDYRSLCQALDERYERFPRHEVNFYKPLRKGEGNF